MNFFLDTNICIYFLKGKYTNITDQLKTLQPGSIKIASIVKAELLLGVEKSTRKQENREKILQFLMPYEVIGFDDVSTGYYAQIRANLEIQGKKIGPNDIILAATVMAHKGILVTNNEKEFKRIKGLKVENWI